MFAVMRGRSLTWFSYESDSHGPQIVSVAVVTGSERIVLAGRGVVVKVMVVVMEDVMVNGFTLRCASSRSCAIAKITKTGKKKTVRIMSGECCKT